MKKLYTFFFLFVSFLLCAQNKASKDTITRRATIGYDQKGNLVSFKPETPPLIQIAGAPKPYYSYFWEFGDGHYSKEATPKHTYKKKAQHKVSLQVTNNYDNGKAPATRPKVVAINTIDDAMYQEIASLGDTINYKIFNTRDPIPDEEMVVVVSYQNLLNYVATGKLYLFYNEKAFKDKNFELLDYRAHNNEKEITEAQFATVNDINNSNLYLVSNENEIPKKEFTIKAEDDLEQEIIKNKALFQNVSILEFENLNPKETRNIFYSFKTTPEMIKDTSATIKMRGIFVPDRNYKNYKKKTLEMEIVTSHDPNKMSSNGSFMNYRLVRFKTVNFKIKFQNNGEGPARTIKLETDTPDMLDKKTFKVVNMYPECPICPKNETVTYSCLDTIMKQNQIHFTFKNIYLPGSKQKNVAEKDSTKGFVKYSMRFTKDFHKIKTRSRTAIIFDKNEPILTNYATTRFLPGISIGIKSGYNYYSKRNNAKSYFLSTTISPFKSYRWYWQAEFANSLTSYDNSSSIEERFTQNPGGFLQFERVTNSSSNKNVNWEVPVLIRYNINTYLGLGAGLQTNINVSEKNEQNLTTEIFEGQSPKIVIGTRNVSNTTTNSFKNLRSGFLIDFTAGFARIGPSLGARYVLDFKESTNNYWQFYGIWKF